MLLLLWQRPCCHPPLGSRLTSALGHLRFLPDFPPSLCCCCGRGNHSWTGATSSRQKTSSRRPTGGETRPLAGTTAIGRRSRLSLLPCGRYTEPYRHNLFSCFLSERQWCDRKCMFVSNGIYQVSIWLRCCVVATTVGMVAYAEGLVPLCLSSSSRPVC